MDNNYLRFLISIGKLIDEGVEPPYSLRQLNVDFKDRFLRSALSDGYLTPIKEYGRAVFWPSNKLSELTEEEQLDIADKEISQAEAVYLSRGSLEIIEKIGFYQNHIDEKRKSLERVDLDKESKYFLNKNIGFYQEKIDELENILILLGEEI